MNDGVGVWPAHLLQKEQGQGARGEQHEQGEEVMKEQGEEVKKEQEEEVTKGAGRRSKRRRRMRLRRSRRRTSRRAGTTSLPALVMSAAPSAILLIGFRPPSSLLTQAKVLPQAL